VFCIKLIYFSQHFPPERTAAAFRCYENAKAWIQEGIEVTVFTGYPNYPLGKIFDGYNAKLFEEERMGDVRVLRNKIMAKPNTSFFGRILNMLSFFMYGCWNIYVKGREIGRGFDVVLGTSGPIFAALLGYLFACRRHIPFIMELRDITYLQLVAVGKRENSLGVRLMKRLEIFLCGRAKMIVCVTQGFKEILTRECGVASDRIRVIVNGVDVEDRGIREINASRLVLSYFGTLGISQNVAGTLQYAEVIRQYVLDFKYLIIGDGAQAIDVRRVCAEKVFVEILHGMEQEELETYYSDTFLSVVVLRKAKEFSCTIPSKLFQTMGRGIAVLYIGPEGEAAEILRRCGAGIVLTKSVEEDLKDLRVFFSQSDWHDKLWNMGRNGRKAALKYYSRKERAEDYLREIKICVGTDVSR
jgi:glycosyltransferase involved in cell wall biosynthesis